VATVLESSFFTTSEALGIEAELVFVVVHVQLVDVTISNYDDRKQMGHWRHNLNPSESISHFNIISHLNHHLRYIACNYEHNRSIHARPAKVLRIPAHSLSMSYRFADKFNQKE
jgi:hypothetical protein